MSLFGDDCIEDLMNGNIDEEQQLPSDDENVGNNENDKASTKPVKVEPKKRITRNPRHRLTVDLLCGSRGIHTIEEYFKDIMFKGKGHEPMDLDEVMQRLKHWMHRLYPSYTFDDAIDTIEHLGKKKQLQVFMSRYRLGMLGTTEPQIENADDYGNENIASLNNGIANADEPFDEFDRLLGEQIAMSKIETPAHENRVNTSSNPSRSLNATPSYLNDNVFISSPRQYDNEKSYLKRPLSPDSAPTTQALERLTVEQRARCAENRRLAQERLRAKRLKLQQQQ